MVETRLVRFGVEESFSKWRVHYTVELFVNGIKSRTNEYKSFDEFSFLTNVNNPKDLTFHQAEKVLGEYFKKVFSPQEGE